mmetsp:Transcript_13351/g.27353  ORF Transcript_13351/g.27353 Transcript_13351/m.27353 type:complete len:113 (+) Transcript_13351:1481-1819(+)
MVDGESEFGIVPGVSGGEGCSTAGGCATCPFMKMNDLDKLVDIANTIAGDDSHGVNLTALQPPRRLEGKFINGKPAVEVGVESIMHMRTLMTDGAFADELVDKVVAAGASRK